MKIDVTKSELEDIIETRNDLNLMIGAGDYRDKKWNELVRLINKMLLKNNLFVKAKYKESEC